MGMWKAEGDIELDLWIDLPPSFVGALCQSCSHIWPREGSCFHVQPREGYSSHIWPREGFSSRVQPKVGFCPRAWPGEGFCSRVWPVEGFCSWVQFWEPGGLCPQVQPGEGLCSKGSPGRDFVPECSPESPEAHKCPPSRSCSHHLCGGITAGLPVSIGVMAGGSPVSASSLWIQDSALACRPNRSTMAPSSLLSTMVRQSTGSAVIPQAICHGSGLSVCVFSSPCTPRNPVSPLFDCIHLVQECLVNYPHLFLYIKCCLFLVSFVPAFLVWCYVYLHVLCVSPACLVLPLF